MTSAENNGASNHPSTTGATMTTTAGGVAVNDGLIISTTETIGLFLAGASVEVELSDDLRELASSLSDHPTVPYKHLRSIWVGSNPSTRPDLMGLLSGSNFVFCSPKPREKSEELKARLRKLEEASERKAYDELVKDITPKKAVDEPFSSYKDQMGFAFQILCQLESVLETFRWCFTGVCWPHTNIEREDLWYELAAIRGLWDDSWVIGGDFNVCHYEQMRNLILNICRFEQTRNLR